ncbi:Gfo/Idh/MocA family oxidoreductase [soil metagenome]
MKSPQGFNRRQFLRGTTAAGMAVAFPTIITSKAFGDDTTAPASERIRLGFMGVKNQGAGNIRGFSGQKTAEVAAVCDVDQNVLAAAKTLAEERGATNVLAFHDYREMLDRNDIDAIVITTHDHWHALPTVDACKAGKDAFTEKPLSLTIVEGQKMVEAARKYDRVVQTGSQQRSNDRFRRACELVRNGKLGKIKKVTVGLPGVNFDGPAVPDSNPPPELDYDFWLGPAPDRPYNEKQVHYNFRFFWPYSGGQMTNWGAHHLDIVQWALGRDDSGPVEIACESVEYHPQNLYEVPTTCTLLYTYDDGIPVHCIQGGAPFNGTLFEGEEGTLYIDRGKLETNPKEIAEADLGAEAVRLYESRSHFGDWLECIKSREKPICDVAIGHRSATVCHLCNIAARTGRTIRWDPKAEKILGDDEAAALADYSYREPWKLTV